MEETPAQQIPTAEWAVAALGLAIVVVALASLIHEAVSGETSPPEITISVMSIQSRQTGHLVQLQVRNTGVETAAELVIEGVLLTKAGEDRSEKLGCFSKAIPGRPISKSDRWAIETRSVADGFSPARQGSGP